jgi:hypothetical protein
MIYFLKATAFNLPRVTRLAGILLILLVGLIHLYKFPEHFEAAAYVGVLFLANLAGSLVAAVGIYRGAHGWGWLLGAVIAGGAFVAYLASRTLGLPGFEEAVGKWGTPWGTFSLMIESLFLAGYLSLVTGVNVAAPDRRGWHD